MAKTATTDKVPFSQSPAHRRMCRGVDRWVQSLPGRTTFWSIERPLPPLGVDVQPHLGEYQLNVLDAIEHAKQSHLHLNEYVPVEFLIQDSDAEGVSFAHWAKEIMDDAEPGRRWTVVSIPLGEEATAEMTPEHGSTWAIASAVSGKAVRQADPLWGLGWIDERVQQGLVVAVTRKGSRMLALLAYGDGRHYVPWDTIQSMGLIELAPGPKVAKRVDQLFRPALLGGRLDVVIKTTVLDDPDREEVLDGAFAVSYDLWTRMVRTARRFYQARGNQKALAALRGAEGWRTPNGRLLGLVDKAGVPLGMLKGQMFVEPPKEGTKGCDFRVTTHKTNLKKELKGGSRLRENRHTLFLAQPQPGHIGLKTSGQSWRAFRPLFKRWAVKWMADFTRPYTPERVAEALDAEIERLSSAEIQEALRNGIIQDGVATRNRRRLAEWIEAGADPKALTRAMRDLIAWRLDIVDRERCAISLPIPGSDYAQVIPESLWWLAQGHQAVSEDRRMEPGTIRFDPRMHVWVIPDACYCLNRRNHGGPDGDDKYGLVVFHDGAGGYRAFVFRSPCAVGEWSDWKVVGDLPKGLVVPDYQVWVDPRTLGMSQLTEYLASGHRFAEFPEPEPDTRAYNWETIRIKAEEYVSAKPNPGRGVLLAEAWGWVTGRPSTIESEKIIDLSTQTFDPGVYMAVQEATNELEQALGNYLKANDLRIDRDLAARLGWLRPGLYGPHEFYPWVAKQDLGDWSKIMLWAQGKLDAANGTLDTGFGAWRTANPAFLPNFRAVAPAWATEDRAALVVQAVQREPYEQLSSDEASYGRDLKPVYWDREGRRTPLYWGASEALGLQEMENLTAMAQARLDIADPGEAFTGLVRTLLRYFRVMQDRFGRIGLDDRTLFRDHLWPEVIAAVRALRPEPETPAEPEMEPNTRKHAYERVEDLVEFIRRKVGAMPEDKRPNFPAQDRVAIREIILGKEDPDAEIDRLGREANAGRLWSAIKALISERQV